MAVAVSTSTPSTAQIATTAFDSFELIDAELDELFDADVENSAELAELMNRTEAVQRRAHALSINLLSRSERDQLHYGDGHTSAKVMMRHVAKLAGGEAAGRDKCRRMFAKLPVVAKQYRAGKLGTAQVMLLGRVFANPRVRGAMEGRQHWFLKHAKRLSYRRFEQKVLEWQRLIDEDGPEPAGDRTTENRTANLNQNAFDLSWDLNAIFGSVDGAFVNNVHQAYCKALFDHDWAEAKARVGDGVCVADLCRTNAQRKADAWIQIAADAIANPTGSGPMSFTHSIAWSASTYEEMVRRWAGAKPKPFDIDDYRCETADGDPLDPTEAFANSVLNKIRRIVIDAKGVVIDQGRARFFTGLARDAVTITGRECFWPGCEIPGSKCEIDHIDDHAKGGRTYPGNGAPGCGRHNRWKQKGYRVWRDNSGQIHVHRPNGTEIV